MNLMVSSAVFFFVQVLLGWSCMGVKQQCQLRWNDFQTKIEVSFTERTIWVTKIRIAQKIQTVLEKLLTDPEETVFELEVPLDKDAGTTWKWVPLFDVKVKHDEKSFTPNSPFMLSYKLMYDNGAKYFLEAEHVLFTGVATFTRSGTEICGHFSIDKEQIESLVEESIVDLGDLLQKTFPTVRVQPLEYASCSAWLKVCDVALTLSNDGKGIFKFQKMDEIQEETYDKDVYRTFLFYDRFGIPKPFLATGFDQAPHDSESSKVLIIRKNDGSNSAVFETIKSYIMETLEYMTVNEATIGYTNDLNFRSSMKIIRRVGSSGGHVIPNSVLGIGSCQLKKYDSKNYNGASENCVELRIFFFNLGDAYENAPLNYTIHFQKQNSKISCTAKIDWNYRTCEFDKSEIDNLERNKIIYKDEDLGCYRSFRTNVEAGMSILDGTRDNDESMYALKLGSFFAEFYMKNKNGAEVGVCRFGDCTPYKSGATWSHYFVKVAGKSEIYGVKLNEEADRLTLIQDKGADVGKAFLYELLYLANISKNSNNFPQLLISEAYPDLSRVNLIEKNPYLKYAPLVVLPEKPLDFGGPIELTVCDKPIKFEAIIDKFEIFLITDHIEVIHGSRITSEEANLVIDIRAVSSLYSNLNMKMEKNWAKTTMKMDIESATAAAYAEDQQKQDNRATKGLFTSLFAGFFKKNSAINDNGNRSPEVDNGTKNIQNVPPTSVAIEDVQRRFDRIVQDTYSIITRFNVFGEKKSELYKISTVNKIQCEYNLPRVQMTLVKDTDGAAGKENLRNSLDLLKAKIEESSAELSKLKAEVDGINNSSDGEMAKEKKENLIACQSDIDFLNENLEMVMQFLKE